MDSTIPAASDVLMSPPPDNLIEPLVETASSKTEDKEASDLVSEPSDDFVDLTSNITDSPDDLFVAESTVAKAAKVTTEISLEESMDEFVDLNGSETEAVTGRVVTADVTVEEVSDKREVTSGSTDPLGDGKTGSETVQGSKESSAALLINITSDLSACNTQQPQSSAKIVDPLVDLLSEAPSAADAKKPSQVPADLFEDEGGDLFTEPWQTASAKQPQKSLFGETDDDLFGEPLGITSKKASSKEQKSKPVAAKTSGVGDNIGGSLEIRNPTEPADIFTEEAVTTVPSVKNTSTVKSKTNGVHSEEDTDIFAGRSSDLLIV